MTWVIVGCNKLCPAVTGLSLVTLFSPLESIEDHLLLWMVVMLQTYYPEHILTYGSEKACYALIVGFGSFWTDWLEARKYGGLSTILRPDLKCGGLKFKFGRGPGPLDRSGMGSSRLYLGYKQSVCFGVPRWVTLVHKSPLSWDGTTWLWSSTIVRTGIRRWWNDSDCSTLAWK